MSAGEVEESDFEHSVLAQVLYAVFLMTVVVLLANVLAYLIGSEIYHHEDHAIRFWGNRLEYILSLGEFSSSGPFLLLRKLSCAEKQTRQLCERLLSLFSNKHMTICSCQFWVHALARVAAIVVVCPIWLVVGLATGGFLWPPQFREYLFYAPHSIGEKVYSQDDQSREMRALKSEVIHLNDKVNNLETKLDELLEICRSKI